MPRDFDDRSAYDRARDAFDELSSEDQARFLMEKTTSAVSRGARTMSRALADELENLFNRAGPDRERSRASDRREPSEEKGGPGPAQPPTDAQRAPGGSGGPDV
jgi:hypothetical protein